MMQCGWMDGWMIERGRVGIGYNLFSRVRDAF